MTQEEYDIDHPNLDWDKLHDACIYALEQLYVAALKDADAPCSAEEHRSMAYRKLRQALIEKSD